MKPPEPTSTPLFHTHHPAPGALASLTFGQPGYGAGIEMEHMGFIENVDLHVTWSHGPGKTATFPFNRGADQLDHESQSMLASMDANDRPNTIAARWRFLKAETIKRQLTLGRDRYEAEGATFSVYTPWFELPSTEPDFESEAFALAVCPAILLELEYDNSAQTEEATLFLGFSSHEAGSRLYPFSDDATAVCGVGMRDQWALAARQGDGAFLIKDGMIASAVERGEPAAWFAGGRGGVALKVPAAQKGRLSAVLAFHRAGEAARNPYGEYAYLQRFQSAIESAAFLLNHTDRVRERVASLSERVDASGLSATQQAILAQAAAGYGACAQLITAKASVPRSREATLSLSKGTCSDSLLFAILEGGYCWRNTLDLAIDQMAWEIAFAPAFGELVLDSHLDRYSYVDEVDFPDTPGTYFPGGISFTHDQGAFLCGSPAGSSGYERANLKGCYSFMTTEELLNGGLLLCGHLNREDLDSKRRERYTETLSRVLASIENREHHDPSQRDGILKGRSSRCGPEGEEITSYDSLSHSLCNSRGNGYITLKSWVLARAMQEHLVDPEKVDAARALAGRIERALIRMFDEASSRFPANIYLDSDASVLAMVEPLALLPSFGLDGCLAEHPELRDRLVRHARSCLKEGECIRASDTTGLRISSDSRNSWPSKVIACLAALDGQLGIDIHSESPSLLERLRPMLQEIPGTHTLCDQIDVEHGKVIGGLYYPRMVSAALWMKP